MRNNHNVQSHITYNADAHKQSTNGNKNVDATYYTLL